MVSARSIKRCKWIQTLICKSWTSLKLRKASSNRENLRHISPAITCYFQISWIRNYCKITIIMSYHRTRSNWKRITHKQQQLSITVTLDISHTRIAMINFSIWQILRVPPFSGSNSETSHKILIREGYNHLSKQMSMSRRQSLVSCFHTCKAIH